MAQEPHEDSKALMMVGEGNSLPAPVNPTNTDVVTAGAVAVGVIAAALAAGGIALGRTLIRSITQARRVDEPRPVVAAREDDRAERVIQVTRVSMVVVEEWVNR
jgi:hypothetical protein